MRPGQIDEDGWRMPKKPRAIEVYYLAKKGLKPREIAKLTGLKPSSVRVMTYWMRNPKQTIYGFVFCNDPKTPQKRYDFSGKYTARNREFRERETARELYGRGGLMRIRELKAYGESRYD